MDISLGILAAGRGSRMGGRDKGLIVVDGQPLIGHLTASQNFRFSETLISCRRNHWLYNHYADRVLCDAQFDEGPVAGVLALLAACETPLLAILPVDQYPLPQNGLNPLLAAANDSYRGYYASDEGRHTPCCLLPKSALGCVATHYENGGRALAQLYRQLSLKAIEIPGLGRDVDTPTDLQ